MIQMWRGARTGREKKRLRKSRFYRERLEPCACQYCCRPHTVETQVQPTPRVSNETTQLLYLYTHNDAQRCPDIV
jgi:hypothetical protein